MVWSTGPSDDPRARVHAMLEDYHGRPSPPICGVSSNGLRLRAWMEWEDVPDEVRCEACAGLVP